MVEPMYVTVAEVAAAIRKNGWKKAASWGDYHDGKFVGGCALAQGGVNLGCSGQSLRTALDQIKVLDSKGTEVGLGSWIMDQNDHTSTTVGEIGRLVERRTVALRDMYLEVAPQTYKT